MRNIKSVENQTTIEDLCDKIQVNADKAKAKLVQTSKIVEPAIKPVTAAIGPENIKGSFWANYHNGRAGYTFVLGIPLDQELVDKIGEVLKQLRSQGHPVHQGFNMMGSAKRVTIYS